MIHWGFNYAGVATCRHVLGNDARPICGQTRGRFEELLRDAEAALWQLPICARCQPLARMRGFAV